MASLLVSLDSSANPAGAQGTLALGAPAKVPGPLAGTPAERWVRANPEGYQALAQRHKASVQPC